MRTRPYTYNTGAYINGTKQVGNIAGLTGNTLNPSPDTWVMGPDEDLGYVITGPTLGRISSNPANSASEIKTNKNGVYWINLPTVGATQVYCLMDEKYDGGGWMMMMKATRGTTFQYSASYWTTNNTLSPTDLTRSDADAKYNTMNYFQATDMMAIFPDIITNGVASGSISNLPYWSWLQNDFYSGTPVVPITFFNTVSRYFIQDAVTYSGWGSGVFSSQTDVRFYGYNYYNNQSLAKSRWGFGWNENGGGLYPNGNMDSDDVAGGIGMEGVQQDTTAKYSAGDVIGCCQNTTGINRSARVEVYVR